MMLRVLAVSLLLFLAGCQTAVGIRETHKPAPISVPEPIPSPLPGPVLGQPSPIAPPATTPPIINPALPDASALASYPQTPERISGSAVVSLLKQASAARSAGQSGQATAALERALRIEPRNYFVWSALATTYLQSKDYEQAESVAKKSNSLARGNVYVEQENWRVIHEVRIAVGDADGATLAQTRLDAIKQLLSSVAPPQ